LAPSEETSVCLRLQKRFRKTSASDPQDREERKQRKPSYTPVYVQELHRAELHIIKLEQNEAFPDEIKRLKSVNTEAQVADRNTVKDRNQAVKRSNLLYKLDPFLDENGVLRVGGRIRLSSLPCDVRHPIILPKKRACNGPRPLPPSPVRQTPGPRNNSK